MKFRISVLAGLISTALLAACSSSDDAGVDPGDLDGGNTGTGRLKQFDDSGAFLDAVRAGLIAQVGSRGGGFPESGVDVSDEGTTLPPVSPTDPVGSPSAESDALNSSTDGSTTAASGNEVTSTNVQELGVDEQDWVKLSSDGNRLYVLDNDYPDFGYPVFEGPDVLVDPVVGAPGVSSFPVPQSSESTLRIMQLDVDAPDASSLKDLTLPLDGRYAEGFYLYENAGQSQVVVTASGNNYWAYWADSAFFGGIDSQISRIDVTDAANASVTASLTLDGQIVSSRRIGKYLFIASRFYPTLPGIQPYEVSQEQWQQAVNDADATDLMPQYRVTGSESSSSLIDPAGCFVTESATSSPYYSPDIITLAVLDLETFELSDSECYLGATETLYASPNAVFLATTQYDYSTGPVAEDGVAIDTDVIDLPADIVWFDPRVDTDIHQFDIDAGELVYAGSGTVDGHLGWDELRKPFRMSEKDGYLRVATVNDRQGLNESPILLTVLQADGTGKLDTVSKLPNSANPGFIGKPGEQLYASRFLGDRAYLVTFRQTDPLYVIDLANPSQPVIAGELEIAGYSDYLHPIDDGFLLGIGKDAVPAPDNVGNGRGALVQGIKIALFNVSNPASPREVQSMLIGQRGTESRALGDHRAITVQSATAEHPTRVSFGIDVNGQAFPSSSPTGNAALTYYPWSYSGLHGFDIRTGSDAGITSRGALVVERASDSGFADSYPGYFNDRSVMVNDSLFYIRGNKVYAAPWDNLSSPTPAR